MKNALKPYSFLLYFLTFLTFFLAGVFYAKIVEAGKDQMLAGAAIVLSYGVIASTIALVISIVLAINSTRKTIIIINRILGLTLALFIGYFVWNYNTHVKPNEEQQNPTSPTTKVNDNTTALLTYMEPDDENYKNLGLAMFSPNIFENKTLYFYGDLILEKSIQEHSPIDSISFRNKEYGGFEIATAPPWLVPEHLKLDYDLFYFKVLSVTEDFLEVTVNKLTGRTAYVDKKAGELLYWPDFFLSVSSVEFLIPNTQNVYFKPLDNAGKVGTSYSFMKPLRIQQEWMYVQLLNDSFKTTGDGWIKWIENGTLLITYSLLS